MWRCEDCRHIWQSCEVLVGRRNSHARSGGFLVEGSLCVRGYIRLVPVGRLEGCRPSPGPRYCSRRPPTYTPAQAHWFVGNQQAGKPSRWAWVHPTGCRTHGNCCLRLCAQAVHRDAEPTIEQRVRGAKGSEASAHATSLVSRADADLTWPHHPASEARLAIQDFVTRRLQASKSIIPSGYHVQVKIQPRRGTVLPRDRSDPGFKPRRHFPKVVTGRMSVPTPGISLLKPIWSRCRCVCRRRRLKMPEPIGPADIRWP